MKYKYHEQREILKKNHKYVLPEDINAPIIKYLEENLLPLAVKTVKRYQDRVNHGRIEIFSDINPKRKITVNVSYGMVSDMEISDASKDGNELVVGYRTIKNANVDMKNYKKE